MRVKAPSALARARGATNVGGLVLPPGAHSATRSPATPRRLARRLARRF